MSMAAAYQLPNLSPADRSIVVRLVPHGDVEWRDPETDEHYVVVGDDGSWVVSTMGSCDLVEIAYAIEKAP